ncbi:MAG: hypothetical protein OXH59_05470 [Rhodospirillaceae bacterium]|nr:hypothetical protein [Rhodospirillaceae bacterium]
MLERLAGQIRPNVVILFLLAAAFLVTLSLLGAEISGEVIGGYVGALAGVAGRLLDPPPDPAVPVSALSEILRRDR